MNTGLRIYPIFLPHAGCPFQCVYCNQHAVTSSGSSPSLTDAFREQLARLTEEARRSAIPGEIAFYGGTFTALPASLLRDILDRVSSRVQKNLFTGIRFSTRPDGITPEVCSLLNTYPVRTAELGVQSFSDEVLLQSRRGYNEKSIYRAVSLIRKEGWGLGLQLMVGLPGDTQRHFLDSVSKAIALEPDFIRIYPTLVLQKTLLAEWYQRGLYFPLELEEALDRCAAAYEACLQAGVPIARMGLHADAELEKPGTIVAGPYHPAFGYLVRVRWWRTRIDEAVAGLYPFSGTLLIRASKRSVSEILGPGRNNVFYWQEKWHVEQVKVTGESDWTSPGRFECSVSLLNSGREERTWKSFDPAL